MTKNDRPKYERAQKLPARERVTILQNRIRNLKAGSGEFANEANRQMAIWTAEGALDEAIAEMAAGEG